jgi:hypothetical protein
MHAMHSFARVFGARQLKHGVYWRASEKMAMAGTCVNACTLVHHSSIIMIITQSKSIACMESRVCLGCLSADVAGASRGFASMAEKAHWRKLVMKTLTAEVLGVLQMGSQ